MGMVIVCNGAKHLGINSVNCISNYFSNGEVNIEIKANLQNKDIFILQSFDLPNTHLMELLCTIDACKREYVNKIHVIIPYFPYCRGDKKFRCGMSIPAKVVTDILSVVNPDSIISFDLHATQIQGFFNNNIRFHHIGMGAFFTYHLKKIYNDFGSDNWVFVSPDAGAVKRTKDFALLSNSRNICNMIKYRKKAQEIEEMILVGDVKDKYCVIFDDIADTCGTLRKAVDILYENGAKYVVAVATHGLFSDKEKVDKNVSNFDLYVTDSINSKNKPSSVKTIPISDMIHEIIYSINNNINLDKLSFSYRSFNRTTIKYIYA